MELPPSIVARFAAPHNSSTRRLWARFSSPTDSAKTRANSTESGTIRSPSHALFPTSKVSTNNVALAYWSACMGHVSISTPAAIPSNTEFQPQ
ncbi:hypothetical protein F8388_000018 [Cannabis sativa]|uniref:Uncharacterized protein n=1 Tax=Cannabis sativa TaxID=3483 RepID=A0A7J6GTE3_CANSA|nr:hypothetical protein F8388_000018 [Cannabis sativa]KAF4386018.1 hypothetical protein G4B88_031153 [Cannabis sativa]